MSRLNLPQYRQSPSETSLRVIIEQLAARGVSPPDISRTIGCDLKYAYQIAKHVVGAGRGDDTMPDDDVHERHVEAVLSEGSFPTVYRLDGKAYWINIWGRPWAHGSLDGSRAGRAA